MGYGFAGFPFNGLIFLAFLLDPDTVLTVISIPWFFLAFLLPKTKEEK
jgi:hypothetical protein